MKKIQIHIDEQFVKLTDIKEKFYTRDGIEEYYMHYSQKVMRDHFDHLPLFTFFYAPTGTGKSYSFVFPVLKAANKLDKKKGLLVLPTNTLIDELHENFSATFHQLEISKLTGNTLDQADKKGSYQRWMYCIETAAKSDIVITNPDILNYAMHGGYDSNIKRQLKHKNSGGKSIISLLEKFDYFVFDEFHLYDEEQIANILTLVKLREFFIVDSARFLFVSATPERKLEAILSSEGIRYKNILDCLKESKSVSKKHFTILEEQISSDVSYARKIKGKVRLDVILDKDFFNVILNYKDEIKKIINNQKRVLIIFNSLANLKKLKLNIASLFGNENIEEISGYHQKPSKNKPVILATSKVEVGANFGVDFGIMQTGFNSRSCIQRLGRYARGGKSGQVILVYDALQKSRKRTLKACYSKFLKAFQNNNFDLAKTSNISYTKLVEYLKESLDDPQFYIEKVPLLYGEYLFAIKKNFIVNNNYEASQIFKELVVTDRLPPTAQQRYKYFYSIDIKIQQLVKQFKSESIPWQNWWDNYLKTYLTFRNAIPTVQVKDMEEDGLETEYSIEWLLMHKEIIERIEDKQGNVTLVVGGILDSKNNDIQYEILTMPFIGGGNRFLDNKQRQNPSEAFKKTLTQLLDSGNNRSAILFANEQQILRKQLLGLHSTYSEKRFMINTNGIYGTERNFI
ncbi:type I-D CRISPR-associated helicase Cas3' [Chondrinema litorale]|uniref:type I-D CRISPR-associated helicase Cas3' n=1 Tax=Chondrinema litorale TaxID=2994555 RepID=UPI0025435D9B|nr:type I-D CRISPR-associated helicase Cas3' [Chondrinema litorale]UZR99839.1 type I-D CRISPR-associated helicase Cas3' [Chondrinema litorale]